MSSSNHPIIVLSDSDIEDSFSSTNVPDYFPATPGNTSPDSLNDLTKYLLATLVFSPLHDDPYMEIMQAYDATNNELHSPSLQAPIAAPTVVSPSSVLSLSPIMPPKKTSTSEAPAMTQAAIKKLVVDSVSAALEAQAANIENTPTFLLQCNYTEDCKVKFAAGTLTEDALSWWNSYAKPIGIEQADKITWTELKRILTNKYFPRTKVKKMEDKFYNLVVKGNDLKTYIRIFQ
nr:reverse transcriptase domain-containing protein [Tanacetum cinerariifolium]